MDVTALMKKIHFPRTLLNRETATGTVSGIIKTTEFHIKSIQRASINQRIKIDLESYLRGAVHHDT